MRTIASTSDPWEGGISEIIDARSPSEYHDDHIPGAINLPVLDDDERIRVGTCYKQNSPFEARKLGAGLISQRIGKAIEAHFLFKEREYRPLIYCWRGGQRSKSLATVLSEIGFAVTLLEGGHKHYRNLVIQAFDSLPAALSFRVVSGLTGVGKTTLLQTLASLGGQVLDLEALAKHKGSLLGEVWEGSLQPQPSQRFFESLVVASLRSFKPERPVYVESESNKIGRLYLPKGLWEKMQGGSRIEVRMPRKERIDRLLREYKHLTDEALPELVKHLQRLRGRYSHAVVEEWLSMVEGGRWSELVEALLVLHYDPSYSRSSGAYNEVSQIIEMPGASESAFVACAQTLLASE